MKIKKVNGALTKGGQGSRYLEHYYQVWDEHFWMTPEKGQFDCSRYNLLGTKRTQSWVWRPPPRPKRTKTHGVFVC